MDYTVGETLYFMFTTRRFSTGAPHQLAGTPVVSAYEDDSTTQITAGITLGVDHDGVTGLNLITVVATGGNGFEAGKQYNLVITTGTVDSVSVVGEVVATFSLGAEAAFTRLGAPAGASIAADLVTIDDFLDTEVAAIKTKTDQLTFTTANRVDSQVFGVESAAITAGAIATDAIGAAELATDAVTEIVNAVWAAATRSLTVFDEDSTTIDLDATIRAAVGLAAANLDTQLSAIDDFLDTEVAAIKAKTDNLPSDPADASDIASSFTSVLTALTTIDDFLDTEIAAIKAKTDNLPAAPAATGDIPTAAQNAAGLLDLTNGIETDFTLRQSMRLMLSVLVGITSVTGSTRTFRDVNNSKNRITATVASNGDRSAVTKDAT